MWWLAKDLLAGVLSAKIPSIRCAMELASPVLVVAIIGRGIQPAASSASRMGGRKQAAVDGAGCIKNGVARGTTGKFSMSLLLALSSFCFGHVCGTRRTLAHGHFLILFHGLVSSQLLFEIF
jgi:hypothetical protein